MKRNSGFILTAFDIFSMIIKLDMKKKLILIYSFSTLLFLLIFIIGPSPTSGDTESNFSAGSILTHGKFDALRTPVYPFILAVFKLILSTNVAVKLGVIAFQYLLFCTSIYCFNTICAFFIKNKGISFFIVVCYACHPAILVWQKIIMTESLALSGVVFFLYFSIRFLDTKKLHYSLLINLFVFLLIMLRPGFVILIPIVVCFWLYFVFKRGKNNLIGLAGIGCVVFLTIGYSLIFQKQYGIFSMSTVSDINQYIMLRDAGLIETNNIKNTEFKKALSDSILKKKSDSEYFDEYVYFYSQYGLPASDILVHESIKKNFSKYLSYSFNRFASETTKSSVGFWDSFNRNKYNHYIKWICCPFVLLYFFLILYVYILFKYQFTFKSSLFIYSIAISSIIVLIVGASNSWGRLIVPTIPLLLIMLGQFLEVVELKMNTDNKNAST